MRRPVLDSGRATAALALIGVLVAGCGSDVVVAPNAAGSTAGAGAGGSDVGAGGSGAGGGGSAGAGGAEDCDSLAGPFGAPEVVYDDHVAAIVAHDGRLLIASFALGGIGSVAPDGSDFLLHVATGSPVELAAVNDAAYWVEIVALVEGSALSGGPITPLFTGDSFVSGLVADAKNVYFSHAGTPSGVIAVPLGGGPPTALLDAPFAKTAADGEYVFIEDWTNNPGVKLARVEVTGGPPETLYDTMGPFEETIGGIAFDETHVYITIGGARFCCAGEPDCGCAPDECCTWPAPTGRVMRVPKAGGAAEVLTRCVRLPTAIAVDGADVFVADASGYDISGELLPEDTRILKLAKTPAPPVVLAEHEPVGGNIDPQLLAIPGLLAVLDDHVYYVRTEAPHLVRVPR